MLVEGDFALWELGNFFVEYHRRILGRNTGPDVIPAEARDGLEAGSALIERPAPGQAPTGLVTWSRRGSETWLDFIYSTASAPGRNMPRGSELVMSAWKRIVEHEGARSIRCAFARELAASGDDMFSPLAERLGMTRDDDILLTRDLAEPPDWTPPPAGFSIQGWHDGLLDRAVSVMMAAPDPTRLDEWNEQVCRDEITWAASGHPPGFADGRAVTAWHGNEMAGLALAAADGLVSQVHVLPQYRNMGLGTALLSALLARMYRAGVRVADMIVGDTNGEALRLAERLGFEEQLYYPTWRWQRKPLNLAGVDLVWNGRIGRGELASLFFRCCSRRAFEPAKLEKSFRRPASRLVARHLGELLAVARIVGDGVSVAFVCDLLVDPACRRQGLGSAMVDAIKQRFASRGTRLLFDSAGGTSGTDAFFRACGLSPCSVFYSTSMGATTEPLRP